MRTYDVKLLFKFGRTPFVTEFLLLESCCSLSFLSTSSFSDPTSSYLEEPANLDLSVDYFLKL